MNGSHKLLLSTGMRAFGLMLSVGAIGACTPGVAPVTKPILYIQSGIQMSGYTFDPLTGDLTPLSSGNLTLPTQTAAMTWSAQTKQFYGVPRFSGGSNKTIFSFLRSIGGSIAPGAITPVGSGSLPFSAIGALNGHVYASACQHPTTGEGIYQFSEGVNGGVNPLSNPISNVTGLNQDSIGQIESAGNMLFIRSDNSPNEIEVLTTDSSGNIVGGSSTTLGRRTEDIEPNATGSILYVAEEGKVTSFSTSGGTLTQIDQVTTAVTGDVRVSLDPLARTVFLSGDDFGTVCSIPIDSTGHFSAASAPLSVGGSFPPNMVTDNLGNYLFVWVGSTQQLKVFRINSDGSIGTMTDNETITMTGDGLSMHYVLP